MTHTNLLKRVRITLIACENEGMTLALEVERKITKRKDTPLSLGLNNNSSVTSSGHLPGHFEGWQVFAKAGLGMSSARAVPAALHTVHDLLLQFLAFLLFLWHALDCRLRLASVRQNFAVLCVPQVGVQTALCVQESLMVATFCHLPLCHMDEKRKKKKSWVRKAGEEGNVWHALD